MTRYILVGGCDYKAPDGGKAFCKELIDGFQEPIKILICLFARPKEYWDEVYLKDKQFFAQHLPGRRIEIELAQPATFVEQVKWTNAVYIRGGSESVLLDLLHECGDWQGELNGKTLAGSSAGACILARYYYDLDNLRLGEGLGFLPIKTLVHWKSDYNAPNIDWDKAYSELDSYKEKIKIITLAEGQFEVIQG